MSLLCPPPQNAFPVFSPGEKYSACSLHPSPPTSQDTRCTDVLPVRPTAPSIGHHWPLLPGSCSSGSQMTSMLANPSNTLLYLANSKIPQHSKAGRAVLLEKLPTFMKTNDMPSCNFSGCTYLSISLTISALLSEWLRGPDQCLSSSHLAHSKTLKIHRQEIYKLPLN